ncbi:nascent polypeptide-associated complex subunit alpha, muscle-specific form-like [Amphibalanus amphitrite]|uniref:nascent polypeptide-associated complex subunit alpha, muscle-specific form-like n=1 Tax=Amphibalanus amphitrite TaxID=1232801 RepID=UPI001C906A14|nr:nascent polypeptide-associated complex subunit alpha, muscle-specific form-like [Amphibalanus amphitrite]
MAPVKRPRVESETSAGAGGAAPPASKRPRAVSARIDTGLRAGPEAGAAAQQPPRQRAPLKRPPMAPRQSGQDRPTSVPRAASVPKMATLNRPATVSSEQLEAWRAARRQKLAERILRGRQGSADAAAAAACLGLGAERQRGSAPSRPRAVASRVLQPRPTAAAPSSDGGARKRPIGAATASTSAQRPSGAAAARPPVPGGPPPTVGGIRLNKAAQRRLTLIQARRQQAERDAERRTTLAAPPAARAARRPAVPRRSPPAPTRRSPRTVPGSAPRVTAVKAGLSKQRLAALAKPKQPAQRKTSPPRAARIVKPVQRRATVAPSVGGSLAPPAGLPNTMRRSLSAMHRSRSTSDRSVAVHRPAASVAAVPREDNLDTAGATGGAPPAKAPTEVPRTAPQQQSATPGRPRPSATPARGRPSATPARGRPSATPARGFPSASRPRLPTEQTLQERLEQWLARRGKQLSSFMHLHCFGSELTQPTPSRAQAAKARCSAAPRVQLDPGSPPLRATPTVKVSPTTPVTTAKATPAAARKGAPQTPDAASGGEERMDNVLSDLRELQELGLPSDQVVSWLERLSRDPVSAGRARYWLCRASAAERDGQLDTVLHCFRQASHAQAEPVAELISGLENFVKRAASAPAAPGTPQEASEDAENAPPPADADGTPGPGRRRRAETRTPRRPLLDRSNVFDSSVIKYALVDDETVLKKLAALRLGAAGEAPSGILSVITPVRRSTRQRSAKLLANPHMALFDSVEAISESLRRSALFRKNSALMSP